MQLVVLNVQSIERVGEAVVSKKKQLTLASRSLLLSPRIQFNYSST